MLKSIVRRTTLCAALASTASLSMVPNLRAQDNANKPLLMVSIAPLDQTLKNVGYVTRAAGAAEVSGMMSAAINAYTAGVDRSKPIGLSVSLDENQNPLPIAFLPVQNVEDFFEPLKLFGEIDSLGDGLYAMSVGPQSVFAKSKGGWLFIAQQEEILEKLPADPMALIGKMTEYYDLSVRVDVQNIPANLKDLLVDQMKAGFERSLAAQSGQQTEEERLAAEAMGLQQIEQMEKMIRETKEAVVGWSVDQANKRTFIDFATQFVPGTSLDKQVAGLANLKTQFAGFQSNENPGSLRMTSVLTPEDVQQMMPTVNAAWDNAIKQMESGGASAKDIETAKELIKPLREVLEATFKEGVIDGGAIVNLDGGLSVVAGGRVADGAKLASTLKQAFGKLKGGPGEPKIQFDASTHKNVVFHVGEAPLPPNANQEAKAVFGDKVRFVVGTSDKAIYVAVGKDCEARLKTFLDKNATAKLDKTTPMEMHTDVAPILAFVNSIQPNPAVQKMSEKIQEYLSNDSVSISTQVLPNGLRYRMIVEEGILRAAGAAAKSSGGRGGQGF